MVQSPTPPDAAPAVSSPWGGCVLLFTKLARAGKVKTRLIGELTAEQAAELHAAFLGDVLESLCRGSFHLRIAWALEPDEERPESIHESAAIDSVRQEGGDLGQRLYHGLAHAAEEFLYVVAVGSDHPELRTETVEDTFARLAAGADAVLGPATDGGYYLIGLRRPAVRRELFAGIPWSTTAVFAETVARCRRLGLKLELLPAGDDVDVVADLDRLVRRLAAGNDRSPRSRRLLQAWGRLPGKDG